MSAMRLNMLTINHPTPSAVASLGGLSIAEALHERICLLYLRLEGCPKEALRVAEFDLETDAGAAGHSVPHTTDREALYKRLVEALCGYEEVTGGRVHPVNERLFKIAV